MKINSGYLKDLDSEMIDAHIHLLEIKHEGYNSPDYIINQIGKKFNSMSKNEMQKLVLELSKSIDKRQIQKAVLYILDKNWHKHNWFPVEFPENILPGVLIDPFLKERETKLDELMENNIKFLKILPYEQHIFREKYEGILGFAKEVKKRNMVLTICCAYGSRYLYKTNGVDLVSYLLNSGIDSPIIMAHGGMTRVFDAMSLMLEFPNLYMDLSFTISYWWNSRIIDDYRFVLEKMDYERIFYGSDYPYVSIEDSIDYFNRFCAYCTMKEKDIDKIKSNNFRKMLTKIGL